MNMTAKEFEKKIELDYLTMYLLEGNLLKMVIKEKSTIGINEVKEIQKAKRELIGNQRHSVLLITQNMAQ